MNELTRLDKYFQWKDKEWESLCLRCGGCCGAFDDPCKYLRRDIKGKFYCEIYPYRLGERETIRGEKFKCVPIREIVFTSWRNDYLCAYKKHLNLR